MTGAFLLRNLATLMVMGMLSQSIVHAHAKKTFLMPRAIGMNQTMEFMPWDSELYQLSLKNKCLHSKVQIMPFYQGSTSKSEVGEYFGIGNGKNSFTVGQRYNFDAQTPLATLVANPTEVDGALLSGNNYANQYFNGTVTFNPVQEVAGARVDLEYFHTPQNGFYLHLGMPVVSVSTDMHMTVPGERAVQIAVTDGPNNTTPPAGPYFTLADYFSGKVVIPKTLDVTDRRDPLTKNKIAGKTTRGGVADVDVVFGYRHNCCGIQHVGANLRLTIPTGTKVNGCNLFEPVVGNGQHVGLGLGVDGGLSVWQNPNVNIWLEGGLQFKYLFEAQEARMLGVKGFSTMPALPQYALMSRAVEATPNVGTPLFPAANQLTRDVKVTPGCHVDALLDLSFQMHCFVVDVGYNLYWRDEESVRVREWEDNTYGILATTLLTDGAISQDDFIDQSFVNRSNLDTAAAQTPSQISNKLHAAFNYRSAWGCVPTNVGIGASYEIAASNAVLNQYAVWLTGSLIW